MVMTLGNLYLWARKKLISKEDTDTAHFYAQELLCCVTGKNKDQLLSQRDMYVGDQAWERVEDGVNRLLNDEPLAYVLGEWDFYGLTLHVSPSVLIPRDDTCAVADLAIQKALFLDKDPRILDLCCGSGCIGLAVASRVKDAKVTLADISQKALSVAKENVALNKLSGRVRCVSADALKPAFPFLGKFDMIVSNPPYITGAEMKELPRSVADFEPHLALFGGNDGLDFYRSIADRYRAALKPGGYLAFEFGDTQGDDVCRILEENGYTILERTRDYNDRERAVLAKYGRKEA